MTKKLKIILFTLLLALAIGYVGLYHWAKNRFTELHQEFKQQSQAEGWTIEEDSPLMFSGFPFRLTATQEKFKTTRQRQDNAMVIEAKNIKMHVSIINPFKYNFEGDATLSIISNGTVAIKTDLGTGSATLGYRDSKLEPVALNIHNIKVEGFTSQNTSAFVIHAKEWEYEAEDYKTTDSSDGKILQLGGELCVKDLEVITEKDGAPAPFVHLKKIKAHFKGKMPLTVLEGLKSIVNDPTTSPMTKICQEGGKVPPLKATVDFMEKIESYGKLNIEVEHNNYTINMDIETKLKKGDVELLLTTQVNNLNSLFDAFNLDPTVRLFAHGFVKKESDKSEKAKLIVKLSDGKLFLNDMEIMKVSTPDWDNIVLPADVCSKYTAAVATTPAPVATPF